jgi:hypothetical protein
MQGVELTDWEIDWDLTRDVKMSGSATVAYQSVSGESSGSMRGLSGVSVAVPGEAAVDDGSVGGWFH